MAAKKLVRFDIFDNEVDAMLGSPPIDYSYTRLETKERIKRRGRGVYAAHYSDGTRGKPIKVR